MAITKRVSGDYNLVTFNPDGSTSTAVTITTDQLTIDGDLVVSGSTTTATSSDVAITDVTLVLNKGEVGAGVTGNYSGIEIERGSLTNVGLRWDDSVDKWMATNDGTTWKYVLTSSNSSLGLTSIADDLTPQLGANLDVNGFAITSADNGDVILDADGIGLVKVNHELSLEKQSSDPIGTAGYNKLYAKTPGQGGTGLFFSNTDLADTDELVARKKALVYSIIF